MQVDQMTEALPNKVQHQPVLGFAGRLANVLLLVSMALPVESYAVEPFNGATPATISYGAGRINIAGVSRSGTRESRPGLAAEIEARRQGLERLEIELSKVCKETSLTESWKSAVRSSGSEIYADSAIRILLSAQIGEVIRAVSEIRPVSVEVPDGRPVVFRIPAQLPLLSTQCGAVGLSLGASQSVRVFPSRVKGAANATEIELIWNKSQSLLEPANPAAQKLLSQTTLATGAASFGTAVIRLPIKD